LEFSSSCPSEQIVTSFSCGEADISQFLPMCHVFRYNKRGKFIVLNMVFFYQKKNDDIKKTRSKRREKKLGSRYLKK
jgi:hypothetical protein